MIGKMSFIALFVLLVYTLAGCSWKSETVEEKITNQLINNSIDHGIPKQSLLVIHNKNIIYHNNLNSDNTDKKSIYPIYSVTKLFASTLIMQLYEAGKLKLTDPASKYVSNLPESWKNIRIEQFLNHSSGVPEYWSFDNDELIFPSTINEAFSLLENEPLLFLPDSQIQYTQTNYLVIKTILENITQLPYKELANKRIIKKLDLKDTWLGRLNVPKENLIAGYLPNSGDKLIANEVKFPDYASSHSDAYTTLEDLGKFISSLAQGELVSKPLLIKLWQPYILLDGDKGYFASGWDYDTSGAWQELGHDGGGVLRVRLMFQSDLNDYYILVYLTNGNKDGVWSRTLVDSVQYYVMPDLISRLTTLF
ncbi:MULTISPECIES: serine hydrolase [unclassified Pseudoalteromonas]|uniref:serine hydrolase domain-containing protein n=1 Tax=unclassified Pseudoalteromonas TaxID=194690 RepID=UPI000693A021|nr:MULTISPECIES: serine hydrolase domain-containing protein [unclassified Pseudoalteromonas]